MFKGDLKILQFMLSFINKRHMNTQSHSSLYENTWRSCLDYSRLGTRALHRWSWFWSAHSKCRIPLAHSWIQLASRKTSRFLYMYWQLPFAPGSPQLGQGTCSLCARSERWLTPLSLGLPVNWAVSTGIPSTWWETACNCLPFVAL